MRWGPDLAVRYLLRPAPDTAPGAAGAEGRPELPLDRGRPAGSRADRCASSCASSATSTRGRRRSRTPASSGRRACRPPEPVAVLTLPQRRHHHRRRPGAGADHRRDWRSTRGTPPTSSARSATSTGRARRPTTPAPRTGWATAGSRRVPLRNRVIGARSAARLQRRQPVRRVAPAARPARPAQPRRVPPRAAPAEPDRHRAAGGAAQPATGAARRAGGGDRACPGRYDGSYNDLSDPTMGAVGAAFGRNIAPVYREDLFDQPNPIVVSRELLYREHFIPARSLNMLAAAWIQFQVHDWVNHARHPLGEDDIKVPVPEGMTWSNTPGGPAEPEMRIAGQRALPRRATAPGQPGVRATAPRTGGTARRSTGRTRRRRWRCGKARSSG